MGIIEITKKTSMFIMDITLSITLVLLILTGSVTALAMYVKYIMFPVFRFVGL